VNANVEVLALSLQKYRLVLQKNLFGISQYEFSELFDKYGDSFSFNLRALDTLTL
jgi:hypothetical protein